MFHSEPRMLPVPAPIIAYSPLLHGTNDDLLLNIKVAHLIFKSFLVQMIRSIPLKGVLNIMKLWLPRTHRGPAAAYREESSLALINPAQ